MLFGIANASETAKQKEAHFLNAQRDSANRTNFFYLPKDVFYFHDNVLIPMLPPAEIINKHFGMSSS
jgi:hypothetical protein